MKKLLTLISMFAVTLSSWALKVGDTFNSSNGDYTYEVWKVGTATTTGGVALKKYNNTTSSGSKVALSIIGPDGYIYDITSIEERAYYGRSNITNITIGGNVTSIGFEAFSGTSIKTLEIPSGVISINIGFARGCNKLEQFTVSDWNKIFATYDGALYTKDLTELHTMPAAKKTARYPSQLTSIGSYAFAYSTMETIEIPYGVTKLMNVSFYFINSKTVVIPSSVTEFTLDWGDGLFWGGDNLTDIYLNSNNVPVEKAYEFVTPGILDHINLHVRDDLKKEFKSKWTGFKSINIDCRVGFDLSIDNMDFSITSTERCTVNRSKYDGRASVVPGINYGNVSGENKIPVVLAIRGKNYAVTQIADLTFSHSNATKFTGGENIDSVGYSSFNNCKKLTSVSLPNLSYIRQYAFMECSSLTSFDFNKNLKEIGSDAFLNSGLTGDVVLPYGFEWLDDCAFSGTKVKRMFVPQIKYFNAEMFKGMSSLTELYLNMDVSAASNTDFTGVPATCTLHVPYDCIDSYKANPVWNNAFKSITSGACDFTYGSSVSNAFSSPYRINVINNSPPASLDNVEYAGTAEYVNYPGMASMTKFVASSSEMNRFHEACKLYKMVKIGNHCFDGATNLTDAGLEKMTFLESIGNYAFNGSGVTQITLPEAVKVIGSNAFAGCSKLITIIAEPTTPPSVQASTFSDIYNQATLKVHKSSLNKYKAANYWKQFFKIESIEGDDYKMGDVDGNGVVDITDANILINIILNMDKASNYDGRADVDASGVVDITDINITLNIILGK